MDTKGEREEEEEEKKKGKELNTYPCMRTNASVQQVHRPPPLFFLFFFTIIFDG